MIDSEMKRIIEYFDKRVFDHGDTGYSTLFDDNMRSLEIETVRNWLTETDQVLDTFCGNGISTLEFATRCRQIVGCDFSEGMIASAKRNLSSRRPPITNLTFEHRNIMEIDNAYMPGQFDTIVSIRGLMILPTREMQKEAILKIHGLLPKNGKFIFIEGYRNGLNVINELRKRFSLKPLSEPWFNNYFEEPELSDFLHDKFNVKYERNLDIYFLVSRVLYPAACQSSEPEPNNLCNTVARLLVPYADTEAGTALLICRCLEKK